MDVIEAVLARHSVRDFGPKPVASETVMKILEAATRSPSSSNGQPWEVFVASGQTVERIRKAYEERYLNRTQGADRPADGEARRPRPAFIVERERVLREERTRVLGLDPADPASGRVFTNWAARLYGAPVLVLVCMDKGIASTLDIGMFVQTLCVAAKGYGVDSLIAGRFLAHQDVLRQELDIPESLNIVTGVGLGYPNPDNPINDFRSRRRLLQEVVRFRD